MFSNGLERLRKEVSFNGSLEPAGPDHSQGIFHDSVFGSSGEADDFFPEIFFTVEGVNDITGNRVKGHAVDGEIPCSKICQGEKLIFFRASLGGNLHPVDQKNRKGLTGQPGVFFPETVI